jgi:DNA polymerase elongation subunit (family B)
LNWKYKEDDKARVLNYTVAIASYVTAYARMELLELLESIESIQKHSVLYYDTDSVLYVHKRLDSDVACGDYLGNLTDEISKEYGPMAKCIAFASLGPKNYCYQVKDEQNNIRTVIKVKGISLTVKALELITFEQMVDMAIRYSNAEKKEIRIPQMQFSTSKHHQIFTRYFDKIFRAVSTKRCISANVTLPYGY